jgi:type I restriction enzyme M protein
MERIAEEGCNLNISRHISTAIEDKEIELSAVNTELVGLEKDIESIRDKHNVFLKELGLPPLP